MSPDNPVSIAPPSVPLTLPEVFGLMVLLAALQVTRRTVSRWINRPHDPLPAIRPGGRRLIFTKASFLAWLERQATTASAPATVKRIKRARLAKKARA